MSETPAPKSQFDESPNDEIFGFMPGKSTVAGDIVASIFSDEEWEEIWKQSEKVFGDSLAE